MPAAKTNSVAPASPAPFPARFAGTPPSAPPFEAELVARIEKANADRYPRLQPRTRHRLADGRPRYTNRLVLEKSPYLLQHAHNPVNWFPWGPEAFELAKKLDRPVFLSVGYSTCHWCHVMEEESFEDPEIAELINRSFIAVKVDREERPDVDSLYMNAVYAMRGSGGWPMTVVMTPERTPFFAGTYFPPRAGARGSRLGLADILTKLAIAYRQDHEAVVQHAAEITEILVKASKRARPGAVAGPKALEKAFGQHLGNFDTEYGGMGARNKFPTPSNYLFLLRYHRRTGDKRALEIVTKTLDSMVEGGIYDHVGGGIHRYATERTWLVPHFEKMLYDNGQLVVLLLEAYQVTGRSLYAEKARDILAYVQREMTDASGTFYSATDADSGGEEGTFFVWTPGELDEVLSSDEARVAKAHYGVTPRGNFEHKTTILSVVEDVASVAKSTEMGEADVRRLLASARPKLLAARAKRVHPGLDDKVLASWNGSMISGFARAALVLDEPRYMEAARRAADTLLATLLRDGRLRRSALGGHPSGQLGFLDDYAFVVAALLDLHEASGEPRWLVKALELQAVLDAVFADADGGGYFFESVEHEALLTKQKPDHDGAEPAGNSVAAENLLRLWKLTSDEGFRTKAEGVFSAFATVLEGRPTSLSRMLCALDFYLDKSLEIILVAGEERSELEPFVGVLRKTFVPNRIVVTVAGDGELAKIEQISPLVESKVAQGGKPTAYVCFSGVCKRPATDPDLFAKQIREIAPYFDHPPSQRP